MSLLHRVLTFLALTPLWISLRISALTFLESSYLTWLSHEIAKQQKKH